MPHQTYTKQVYRSSKPKLHQKQKIEYGKTRFSIWQMEFLHPAMWQVALGWHAIEFAQTVAILEFYVWFQFRPHHRCPHVILHQFYPNRTTVGRKNMTSCRFSRRWISAILDFRGPIIGSLKGPCATSYRSSMDTVALNCLVFEKIAIYAFWRQTDRQTSRWTAPIH